MKENEIPRCKLCGTRMAVKTAIGMIATSNYIGGDICHDCMVEHCLATNCLACKIGQYPECEHLELKKIYMNPEG